MTTDLLQEIKDSFSLTKEEHSPDGPVAVMHATADQIPPGLPAARNHYYLWLLRYTRRAYRQLAGKTLLPEMPVLYEATREHLLAAYVSTMMEIYAAGVKIGHKSDYVVRLRGHLQDIDGLFKDKEFTGSATLMATGFADDAGVVEFITQYVDGALKFLAEITGFSNTPDPAKIWDLWLLAGNSCLSASYLAGLQLGTTWYERDVLDGILIATEEEVDGPAREG